FHRTCVKKLTAKNAEKNRQARCARATAFGISRRPKSSSSVYNEQPATNERKRMRRFAAVLLILCLILPQFVLAADEPAMTGYSPRSSQIEREWETKFRAIPDPANLREDMRRLSARPHHVGSAYDKDNAEW